MCWWPGFLGCHVHSREQGAVRIEQQLTGQSVLVPQNGDVSLSNGQLESLRTAAEVAPAKNRQRQFRRKLPAKSACCLTEEIKKAAEERKVDQPPATVPPPRRSKNLSTRCLCHAALRRECQGAARLYPA